MKQTRRWAAWLAAMMIAASLVAMPREGAAWTPYIDSDPPVIDEGEPDGPPNAPVYVSRQPRSWSLSLTFMQGRLFILFGPAKPATNANHRPSKALMLGSR